MARTKCFNCGKTIKKGEKVVRYNFGQGNLQNPLCHEVCPDANKCVCGSEKLKGRVDSCGIPFKCVCKRDGTYKIKEVSD